MGRGQITARWRPKLLELVELSKKLPLAQARLSADCNYHSEANLQACQRYEIDPYIPDNHFRQRDARFATQERHKRRLKKEHFTIADFDYEEAKDQYRCPQGMVLRLYARVHRTNRGQSYRRYRSRKQDCAQCPLRGQCLSQGAQRKWLAIAVGEQPATLTARMRRKIDLPESRRLYSQRLAIVEPVFANLRSNKHLDRFTYRGQVKVNIQWLLYCLVHNLEKLAHRSKTYGRKKPLHRLLRLSHWLLRPLRTLQVSFFPQVTTFCSFELVFET